MIFIIINLFVELNLRQKYTLVFLVIFNLIFIMKTEKEKRDNFYFCLSFFTKYEFLILLILLKIVSNLKYTLRPNLKNLNRV